MSGVITFCITNLGHKIDIDVCTSIEDSLPVFKLCPSHSQCTAFDENHKIVNTCI